MRKNAVPKNNELEILARLPTLLKKTNAILSPIIYRFLGINRSDSKLRPFLEAAGGTSQHWIPKRAHCNRHFRPEVTHFKDHRNFLSFGCMHGRQRNGERRARCKDNISFKRGCLGGALIGESKKCANPVLVAHSIRVGNRQPVHTHACLFRLKPFHPMIRSAEGCDHIHLMPHGNEPTPKFIRPGAARHSRRVEVLMKVGDAHSIVQHKDTPAKRQLILCAAVPSP